MVGMQKGEFKNDNTNNTNSKNFAVKSSHIKNMILRTWLEQSAISLSSDLPFGTDSSQTSPVGAMHHHHHHTGASLLSPTSSFHLRQLCASLTPHLVQQMNAVQIEEDVIPRLIELASDNVWGVRKAVAEVLSEITKKCSIRVRQERLIKLFQELLEDRSRWVRMAGYHNLAGFISALSSEEPFCQVMRILDNKQGLIKTFEHVSRNLFFQQLTSTKIHINLDLRSIWIIRLHR